MSRPCPPHPAAAASCASHRMAGGGTPVSLPWLPRVFLSSRLHLATLRGFRVVSKGFSYLFNLSPTHTHHQKKKKETAQPKKNTESVGAGARAGRGRDGAVSHPCPGPSAARPAAPAHRTRSGPGPRGTAPAPPERQGLKVHIPPSPPDCAEDHHANYEKQNKKKPTRFSLF